MSDKAKTRLKVIIALVLLYAVVFGRHDYNRIINSKEIDSSDIAGRWKYQGAELHFVKDGTILASKGNVSGDWEIINSDEQLVQISFNKPKGGWEDSIYFKSKLFRYIRSDDKLYSIEDGDNTNAYTNDGHIYENDYYFYR